MSHSNGFIPLGPSAQRTPVGSQSQGNNYRNCDRSRRSWSDREEESPIVVMKELVATGWKSDNGFRSGYLKKIEDWLHKEFPTTDLQETPHIQSKITTWKKFYYSLSKMLERSGVGYNDNGDFKISCTDDQWDQIVKQDTHAHRMRNKSWSYLEDWKVIFGKDRATCGNSEHVVQAANNS
ncbi:uncharacterized protein LOC121802748 isoform X1 [Salvia splendens]|uniref:uncharacterized protein LOC121802748 isoform X1 n=1 Tax=Salvia splendens TaxID=180675 RepID=UPI001C253455|nr:uncharacterized protein LOC121802748 isoform X1 [Salvia splendens]